MSCSSPFTYVLASEDISTTTDIGVNGTVTIPGYSLPSEQLCLLGWNSPHLDGWHWVSGSTYWYDCWGTPPLQIYPQITLTGSGSFNMTLLTNTEVSITEETPAQPIATQSITITDADFSFSISADDEKSTVNITIPADITISANSDGEFAITYTLASAPFNEETDGFTYEGNAVVSLLFCLNPTNGIGWINIEVEIEFSVLEAGVNIYGTTFTLVCPIVSPK
jgi:hypothetical protein